MSRQKPTIPRNREPCNLPSEASTNSFWHSEPSALLTAHRSTRELPAHADVVIIGSGMTGTSVAHHLLNDVQETNDSGNGPSVVLLEAREACWGATGRNGGHCQPILFEHPHDPSIGNFELANFHTLQNLIKDKSIDCEFVAQPGVRAIYDQRHLMDVELALLTMQETAPDLAKMMRIVTSKAELEEFRIPTAIAAIVTTIAARMWPYKFVSRILENLLTSTDLNGTFNLQTWTPVECIAPYYANRWTVKTARGCIVASKLVLATNAYTSHLLPSFADLIVPVRGQMSSLVPVPNVAKSNRLKTSLGFISDGLDDYLIQRPTERGGHLMFGGGRQHGPSVGTTDDSIIDDRTAEYLRTRLFDALGLKTPGWRLETRGPKRGTWACPECRRCHRRCTEEDASGPCSTCVRFGLECPPYTTPEFQATHQWTGIMGFSRDDHPWVGPVPEKPNLYIAAGYTGHGMPNTWLCGKAVALMAQKASGETSLPQLDDDMQRAGAVFDTVKEIGLPKSYLVSKERILNAMDVEDVEARDWAEMERGRRRVEGDRPHSGYA